GVAERGGPSRLAAGGGRAGGGRRAGGRPEGRRRRRGRVLLLRRRRGRRHRPRAPEAQRLLVLPALPRPLRERGAAARRVAPGGPPPVPGRLRAVRPRPLR